MIKHGETHPTLDVPGCFGCHAAGVAGFTFRGGREVFHDSDSPAQQERDHVAELKAKGISFDRAPS